MGLFRDNGKKKISMEKLRIPAGRRQISWPFTSVDEDLNSGCTENKSS